MNEVTCVPRLVATRTAIPTLIPQPENVAWKPCSLTSNAPIPIAPPKTDIAETPT
ncbi:hypothetical protein DPMN_137155 [Dreissena polymorpha]|uniref:Uncharacterized protein n=1 Tax=Dreissena polymorpha TaxID=45954 RepID=A0A9D4G4R7_DREPO|nr:hypothetical protein DPMN_137155 [Dreissena polymorpha]